MTLFWILYVRDLRKNPTGFGAVESHPCAQNAQGWGTLGTGGPRESRSRSKAAGEGARSTRVTGRRPRYSTRVNEGVGVFRLRGCFASRSSLFAQDDIVLDIVCVRSARRSGSLLRKAHVATAALSCANSRSIASFTLPSANSAATRTAFLMAFVFDDPWVMMHTPLMPSSGAPPYSV